MTAGLRQWFKALNPSHITKSLDKRHLQAEFDTHRALLLVTAYTELCNKHALDVDAATAISEHVDGLSHEERHKALQQQLQKQLMHITQTIHDALHTPGAPQAGPPDSPDHVMQQSSNGEQSSTMPADSVENQKASWQDVAAALRAVFHQGRALNNITVRPVRPHTLAKGDSKIQHSKVKQGQQQQGASLGQRIRTQAAAGFLIEVAPSGVAHPEAGNGVWIRGRALPGQIVALYPGLVYPRDSHRHLPDYPKVDRNNVYLMSRYDMHVLDAKPWAHGEGAPRSPQGALTVGYLGERTAKKRKREADVAVEQSVGENGQTDGQTDGQTNGQTAQGENGQEGVRKWPNLPTDAAKLQREQWGRLAVECEGRHPLALGHIINHPPPGKHPNVMAVPFDLTLKPGATPFWRRYIPNYMLQDADSTKRAVAAAEEEQQADAIWEQAMSGQKEPRQGQNGTQNDTQTAPAKPSIWQSLARRFTRTQQGPLEGAPGGGGPAEGPHGDPLLGLALVATQLVENEELFLNYRLSPHIRRPAWYAPVDTHEERRRWG